MKAVALGIILAALVVYGGKPKAKTSRNEYKPACPTQQADSNATPTVIVVNQPGPDVQRGDHPQKSPDYFRRLFSPENIPNIALVVVAIFTFRAIWWQARETKNAAQAALLNARAIIDAERSWIITSAERRKGNALSETIFGIKNHGKTPARLVSLRYRAHAINTADILPSVPDYGTASFPATHLLAPSEPWDFCVFRPSDHFTATELGIIGDPNNRPKVLFFYGVVQYKDVFRDAEVHETAFCYRRDWDRWFLDGPNGYNRYT